MFECRKLDTETIENVYNQHMKTDFPKNELKPLSMIKKALKRNEYICYGIFDSNAVCGYAFFAVLKKDGRCFYLLDYFATVKDRRSQGIGSVFLSLLKENISEADIIICEAENPAFSSGNEKIIRDKRVGFYIKNDFVNTNVTANVFGVEFLLLEFDIKCTHSENEIKTAYSELYKSFLPKLMYKKFFHIN